MHSISLQTYFDWRDSGLSQRQFARASGMIFNTVHSRIEYAKTKLSTFGEQNNMVKHTELVEKKTIFGHGETVGVPGNERAGLIDRGNGYYPGRTAIFDIETASLNAQSSITILSCACILTLDTNQIFTYHLQYSDARDDTRLLKEVLAALRGYDILVGHYVNGFDAGWLRTRALRAGLPPLPGWHTIDTLTLAKRTAKKAQRKSLGMLMDLLGIGWEKTSINTNSWCEIFSNDERVFEDTIQQIEYHCQQDVLGTRGLMYKLFPSALLLGGIPLSRNQ